MLKFTSICLKYFKFTSNLLYKIEVNFEVDLKAKGKWEEWVMDQEKKKWETVMEEVADLKRMNDENKWNDKTIANTLADNELEITIKKNS